MEHHTMSSVITVVVLTTIWCLGLALIVFCQISHGHMPYTGTFLGGTALVYAGWSRRQTRRDIESTYRMGYRHGQDDLVEQSEIIEVAKAIVRKVEGQGS